MSITNHTTTNLEQYQCCDSCRRSLASKHQSCSCLHQLHRSVMPATTAPYNTATQSCIVPQRANFVYSSRNKTIKHVNFCICKCTYSSKPHNADKIICRTLYLIFFLTKCLSSFWIDFQQFGVVLPKLSAENRSVSTFQSLQNSIVDKYVLFLHKHSTTDLCRQCLQNCNLLTE